VTTALEVGSVTETVTVGTTVVQYNKFQVYIRVHELNAGDKVQELRLMDARLDILLAGDTTKFIV
jgi:hypothetical protein